MVSRLLSAGDEVTVVDRFPSHHQGVRNVVGDILDISNISRATQGADAILHLAGIPANGIVSDHETFSINTSLTFNSHEAARLNGIRRVVTASSEAVLGWAPHAQVHARLPEYLPIDENHSCRPLDAYGLSKVVSEQIASAFSERCGIEAVALRPPWIVSPSELAALSASRGIRPNRFSLLHYIDVRDFAAACEAAIKAPLSGFETLFVGSGESVVDQSLAEIFARFAPELEKAAKLIPAGRAPVSIAKAQRVLNWQPAFSWRSPARTQEDDFDRAEGMR